MLFSAVVLSSLALSVSAHFQMHFPEPRGPFVEDNEPTFCDGFNNAVDNRTVFPLDNGFIVMNSEHPQWTAGVLISIEQNPTNFSVFNKSTTGVSLPLVHQFFQASGEGLFCFPLDIGAANISGVGDGTNVTIQVEFNGGDGNLFQCADLTLSKSVQLGSNVTSTCTTVVGNTTAFNPNATSTSSNSSSPSASSPASPSQTSSAAEHILVGQASALLVAGAAFIVGFL